MAEKRARSTEKPSVEPSEDGQEAEAGGAVDEQLIDRIEQQGEVVGALRARIESLEEALEAERESRDNLSRRLESERAARARAELALGDIREEGPRPDAETLERLRSELDSAWKRARAAEAELGKRSRSRLRRRAAKRGA